MYTSEYTLPMKEPVLQIRLKKQLSGGRVPHLLKDRVNHSKLRDHVKAAYTCYTSNDASSY